MKTPAAGLRWHKVDLHVHTPASHDYTGPTITADQFIAQVIAKGFSAIAVTDHNSGAWIDAMVAAAKGTGLTIFPGVEISATGGEQGIHVIAIFDTTATSKDVENLLAKVGLSAKDYGKVEAISNLGPEAVVEFIHDAGALAILAHADSSKGVMASMKGQQRTKVMNSPHLDAVELTNPTKSAQYCSGTDPEYKRKLPYYRASDNPAPAGAHGHTVDGVGARYSWFRLDGLSLDALRQVFYDPDQRIKCDEDSADIPDRMYPRVLSLEVSSGFLKGTSFEFHEGLNTVIGGKGVGKSLLIEFLRFGLNQPSIIAAVTSDMNGKLAKQLGHGGRVTVRVQVEADQVITVSRTYNGADNPLEAMYESGKKVAGDIRQLFPVLAYSQTETVEIARDDGAQLALIDSFLELSSIEARIRGIEEKLVASDREIAAAIAAEAQLAEARTQLASTDALIASTEKALKSKELDAVQALKPKAACMRAVEEFADAVDQAVEGLVSDVKACTVPPIPAAFAGDKALDTLLKALSSDAKALTAAAKSLEGDAERLVRKARAAVTAWDREHQAAEKKYSDFVQQEGGDRPKLLARKQALERQQREQSAAVAVLEKRIAALPQLRIARTKLLAELDVEVDRRYVLRRDKYAELSAASKGRLDLQLVKGGRRGRYVEALRELKKGSRLQDTTSDEICAKVEPRKLVELIDNGDAAGLAKLSGIREESAKTLVNFIDAKDDAVALLALQHGGLLEDKPEIRFRKDDGKYYDLSELSVGQKCTALLIIALADGAWPIIIDQPEDALDITSVYEDVTLQLRDRKHARQFIVTTHNPTVAVAGDSDAFHVLKASASRAQLTIQGAIDRQGVREAVIQHLEGGPEPFKLKSKKYGLPV